MIEVALCWCPHHCVGVPTTVLVSPLQRQSRPVLVYGHAVQLEHLSSGLVSGLL